MGLCSWCKGSPCVCPPGLPEKTRPTPSVDELRDDVVQLVLKHGPVSWTANEAYATVEAIMLLMGKVG
jgi:hypothetical protein